ncbi:MAG TPA: class I SAM-dependent methyltransferase [Anaerolineales bacterium]|jgi:hypothetical protein
MGKEAEHSFTRYLLAKQSVDDRALNREVYARLTSSLPDGQLRIIEVGAGIGTMLTRLLCWRLFTRAEYVLVDALPENSMFAAEWLPDWARENGMKVEAVAANRLRLHDEQRQVNVQIEQADVFDFIRSAPEPADLLVAHAFLDLLPMPESLRGLFSLLNPGGLAWFTLNFDGVSSLEPPIEPGLDRKIEQLYHQSMDTRPNGGDSQCGRHLFGHIAGLGASILAAGSSDWVVHAVRGQYPGDEAYFLQHILSFFEHSLGDQSELDKETFQRWLSKRRSQVERGELVYIAHQLDFLVKPAGV